MGDELRTGITFSLKPDLQKKLKEYADQENLSASRYLENILIDYFGKREIQTDSKAQIPSLKERFVDK